MTDRKKDLMTREQEKHLLDIKLAFNVLVDAKYRKGQKEHGGNLIEMDLEKLLDCAIDEAIDQVVYLLTMKQKITILMFKLIS
jgi:hypothetical protein